MSNIFEIDGDIEDNDDEKLDGQESSSSEPEDFNEDDLGATIIDGDDENTDSSSADTDDDSSGDGDEVPWYDKVLSDDDTDPSTPTEEETTSTPVAEDSTAEPASVPTSNTPEPSNDSDDEDDEDEEIESVPEIEGLDDDTTSNDTAEKQDEDSSNDLEEVDPNDLSDLDIDSLAELDDELEEEPIARPKPRKKPKKKPEPKEGLTVATTEEVEEEFDDIFPRKSGGSNSSTSIWTWIFLVLFITCFSMLCYFQFYDGHKFSVSFTHRPAAGAEHALPSEIQQMTDEVQAQKEELEAENRRLAHMMRKKKQSAETNNSESAESAESDTSTPEEATPPKSNATLSPTKGTVYQVQVAALKQYTANLSSASYHMYVDSENGFTKFLIGAFSSEAEVKAFRKKMVDAGFDDAYIVKKVNGERVEYEP